MDENEQIKSNMINGSLNIISGILLGMPISLQNNKNTTNSNDNLHKYTDQKKIISCGIWLLFLVDKKLFYNSKVIIIIVLMYQGLNIF